MITFPTFRGFLNNPGVSYLLSENFEGVGVPSGWVYNNNPLGTGNFDFSTSGLSMEASECADLQFGITGSNGWVTLLSTGLGPLSEAEAYFKLRLYSNPSAAHSFFYFLDDTSTEVLRVRLPTNRRVDIRCQTGTPPAISSGLSTGITYNTWIRWEQGTSGASNPYVTIAFATGDVRPTSGPHFVSLNFGVNTSKMDKLRFGISNSINLRYYIDKIRVTNGTPIPDYPL